MFCYYFYMKWILVSLRVEFTSRVYEILTSLGKLSSLMTLIMLIFNFPFFFFLNPSFPLSFYCTLFLPIRIISKWQLRRTTTRVPTAWPRREQQLQYANFTATPPRGNASFWVTSLTFHQTTSPLRKKKFRNRKRLNASNRRGRFPRRRR